MSGRNRERGSQTLEFTLIGVPIIFLLFSVANMSFAMLNLHTLQEAVEQGARFVSTRGSTCSSGSNNCTATVQQIASVVASSAPGVSAGSMTLTLTPASGTANQISCSPVSNCLSTCASGCNASRTTVWPPAANSDNSPGKDIIISADCSVAAPMFMFWAGSGNSVQIKNPTFHAYSRQRLMF